MRVKKITDIINLKVYTDSGDFFGQIEEANLSDNKIDGWRIKVSGNVMNIIGGAKGIIIPHQFVRAISDIVIISKTALPSEEEGINNINSEDLI
jgi:sporulation protein YlmC with PRC-barrel domain